MDNARYGLTSGEYLTVLFLSMPLEDIGQRLLCTMYSTLMNGEITPPMSISCAIKMCSAQKSNKHKYHTAEACCYRYQSESSQV